MKKVLPIIIVILLILGIGGFIGVKFFMDKYQPTENLIDYAQTYGLSEGEYTITLNHELTEEKAVEADGRIYLPMTFVTTKINSRIYWDSNENMCLYTTPTDIIYIYPEQQVYKTGDTDTDDGYVIVKMINNTPYIAADYVTAHTQMNYNAYTEPSRIAMETVWKAQSVVTAAEDTDVRYKGGVKAEVLSRVTAGTSLIELESYEDWIKVATGDGYIGWVKNSSVSAVTQETPEAPAFEEAAYTSIQKDYKINMAWHQVMTTDSNSSIDSVLTTIPGVNTISPTWFYFSDTEGNVSSIASADYVQKSHDAGLEVWALFSNEFAEADGTRSFNGTSTEEVLSHTSKRAAVISQIMSYAQQYSLDGINIDFEAISEGGADDYVQFIRELSIQCRAAGIVLSVDNYVPKYTSYYNRKEQGIVADYVIIMGYDEYTAGSASAGPVASLPFVQEGITDTLAMVPAEKVINAIPLYSRVWRTAEDGALTTFACGMEEAAGYLTDHQVTPQYMDSLGLNYGSYTSDTDGALYEIWLQDATAVTEEMKLIQSNNLAGVASWKIGFESGTEIWNIISSYLGK